jgi:hypothetical protein
LALAIGVTACNVNDPLLTTGGMTLDAGNGSLDGGNALCPKALVVLDTDYKSTNVSLASPTGAVLSEVLISSGTGTTGLSTPLSGDVVLPLATPPSSSVVLLDRSPSVVTWVDPATASVLAQLNVSTGFFSNPHDYLEVSPSKAYVTRYETNAQPGRMPNDGGGDVLIVDHQAFAITGRIDLADPTDTLFTPHPDHVILVRDQAWVVLHRYPADNFDSIGDARVVGISIADDSVAWTVDLPGFADCAGVAVSPSGNTVALSCSGLAGARTGVVLLDATASRPAPKGTFDVASKLGTLPGFSLAFASETLLLGTTLGYSAKSDAAYTIDTASGSIDPLLDGGAPFVLGDVRCAPGCTDLCFLADANDAVKALHSWKVANGALAMHSTLSVDPSIGLAPRLLGGL